MLFHGPFYFSDIRRWPSSRSRSFAFHSLFTPAFIDRDDRMKFPRYSTWPLTWSSGQWHVNSQSHVGAKYLAAEYICVRRDDLEISLMRKIPLAWNLIDFKNLKLLICSTFFYINIINVNISRAKSNCAKDSLQFETMILYGLFRDVAVFIQYKVIYERLQKDRKYAMKQIY